MRKILLFDPDPVARILDRYFTNPDPDLIECVAAAMPPIEGEELVDWSQPGCLLLVDEAGTVLLRMHRTGCDDEPGAPHAE